MKNTPQTFELNQPLPQALFETASAPFSSYRGFAVFSRPWVVRRTLWVIFWSIVWVLAGLFNLSGANVETAIFAQYIAFGWSQIITVFGFAPLVAHFGRRRFINTAKESQRTIQTLGIGMMASLIIAVSLNIQIDRVYIDIAPRMQAKYGDTYKSYGAGTTGNGTSDIIEGLKWISLVICIFGGGYSGFAYLRERRRMFELAQKAAFDTISEEKLNADSKLTVLQAQVEPHFLFNSLASVRALVKQDPTRAHASIDALVEYLRATIPQMRAEQDGQALSTVAQQVDLATAYLNVMAHRMGERLRVKVDVPESLSDAPFPPLLLISLVENAVKHGAEPNADITTICISVGKINDKQLFVRVIDDGAGLVPHATNGIGLANICAQLAARFDDAASFKLQQGADAKGVIAEIIVPIE